MERVVYISGGMSGIKDLNRGEFKKASDLLKSMEIAHVNPIDVGESIEKSISEHTKEEQYSFFMKADIIELMKCNAIYLLNGWEKSKGATMEKTIADFFKMEIINEGDYICKK